MTNSPIFHSTVTGVPRIGPNRELKKTLEAYWKTGSADDAQKLSDTAYTLNADITERILSEGLDQAPTVGRSFYDAVLDTSALLGVLPQRFSDIPDHEGPLPRHSDTAFATARGTASQPASAMTKWFDTNYHYIVPELAANTTFRLNATDLLNDLAATPQSRPVFVGPFTYLALSRTSDGSQALDHLEAVAQQYAVLLDALKQRGIACVQFDEPALVTNVDPGLLPRVRAVYQELVSHGVPLIVTTYFGDATVCVETLSGIGLDGFGVDLVTSPGALPAWTGEETLVAGIVDGRNVWRTNLDQALGTLQKLSERGPVAVSTSCSLLHVPYTTAGEDLAISDWLAFGWEKIHEVGVLARALRGESTEADLADFAASRAAAADRAASPLIHNPHVQQALREVTEADRHREAADLRKKVQAEALNLPPLPTTTIGSFPQTPQIRQARAQLRRGDISAQQYHDAMVDEVKLVIAKQEELGLDVLVHGEPERNDMVQYFSEQLAGYAATHNGWVQSYGSRCVRPPIIFGDVSRPAPMTVDWYTTAAGLTDKHVKGMLTGPITMLAWSFVRDDQPLGTTADQVALALRAEIADLVAAGAQIIQVDEPAIRELLPLRVEQQPAYLKWAVGAFRLATSGVAPEVQIHTHMCYSEFNELIDTVADLDADVTSIEAARNGMQVLAALKEEGYELGVGPGVWDIHSPRVPAQQEVDELLASALTSVDPHLLWVNPDCGLKTRGWPETLASLQVLVSAAIKARAQLI